MVVVVYECSGAGGAGVRVRARVCVCARARVCGAGGGGGTLIIVLCVCTLGNQAREDGEDGLAGASTHIIQYVCASNIHDPNPAAQDPDEESQCRL